MRTVVTLLCGGLLVVLVAVTSAGGSTLLVAGSLVAAVGVTLLILLGPDRLGLALLLLATAMAPMNRLRIGESGNVTFSDLVYLGAFALLVPRLLTTARRLPKLYTLGVTVLTVNVLFVSLLSPSPVLSLVGFAKVAWAVILLPILINRVGPDRRLMVSLAWAFVLGQLASLGYTLAHSTGDVGGGRAAGYTQHPGFFGLAGQLAVCLCIFLFYEVDRRHRWLVVAAMTASGASVLASGARASLLCMALTLVLWPLVERTAVSIYLMLSAAAVLVASANAILSHAPEGSALARLQGEGSATGSDLARKLALEDGLRRFWEAPLRGSGFNDILQIHNVYVEVAVGGGVLALVGFLFVLGSLIKPLFRPGVPNRLSHLAVSYAAFGLIGPTLSDRVLWAALALAVAGHDWGLDRKPGGRSSPAADDLATLTPRNP
jgi:O-antigen ligase